MFILGKTKKTKNGLEIIEFTDQRNQKCSLQADKLANYEAPGTLNFWLGRSKYRMLLSWEQIISLIDHLRRWIDHDTFSLDENYEQDNCQKCSAKCGIIYKKSGWAERSSLKYCPFTGKEPAIKWTKEETKP